MSTCRNVYDLVTSPSIRTASDPLGGLLFEAVMLLTAVSSLDAHFIQPSLRAEHVAQPYLPEGLGASPSTSTAGLTSPPFLSPPLGGAQEVKPIPAELLQAESALLRFVEGLPPQYRDPSKQQRGGIPPWHRYVPVSRSLNRPLRPERIILIWLGIVITAFTPTKERTTHPAVTI